MGTKPTGAAIAVFALLCANNVAAVEVQQDSTQSAETTMENMVVIGRNDAQAINIAANVKVIDAVDIEMSGATDLAGLLRNTSGIQVSDNNSGPVFAMRGFSASQAANNTLILVDGRRLNNIDISAPSLDSIALVNIERIELLSGSAGVLYGDQAVGGVINIITKAPTGSGGGIELSGGTYDTYQGKFDLGGAINENWRYFLAGSYLTSDNYRDNNEQKTANVLGRLQYQDTNQDFYFESSYYDNDRQTPGALSAEQLAENPRQANPFNVGDFMHEKTTALRSGYQYQLNQQWSLGVDVSYADTDTDTVQWGSPGKIERQLFSINPKAVANYQLDAGELTLVTGVDINLGKADFLSMSRSNEQTQTSAYVQVTAPLTQQLSYVVGGRYAKAEDELVDASVYPQGVELDQSAHAFELGLNYRPSAAHRFYVRADDNFRFAKVDEQAYTSPGTIGLDPQTGRSYELGWDWQISNSQLSLNAYRLDLEDEIVFDPSAEKPIGGGFDGANVNADASRRYGLNGQYELSFAKDWLWGLEYNYIDAEFVEGSNEGKALSWVAKHSGRSFISFDFNQYLQMFVEASYTGERYIEGDNANVDEQLDSYVLTNLALNYRRDNWQGSLRVDNLLDEEYIGAGYYSSWGNGYYPGSGREIRLTAGYRF
ncbi:TonB-dependent receptor [Shewanella maritima]|uniref:TonB-dependent receptor n=1 Tax=Shewanella maritima TaxID=2520507 RepID=UPI003734E5F0